MDELIALAVFIVLTPFVVMGVIILDKIKAAFKKELPPPVSTSYELAYGCPNCSADITDYLGDRSSMGRPYAEYTCTCGCISSWDIVGHPFICLRSKMYKERV
jgi:hypothetical protein